MSGYQTTQVVAQVVYQTPAAPTYRVTQAVAQVVYQTPAPPTYRVTQAVAQVVYQTPSNAAAATGSIPTETIIAPTGAASAPASAQGALASETVSPVTAAASSPADATGALPTDTTTSPGGKAGVPAAVSGDVGLVASTAASASAAGAASGTGSLPQVSSAPIGGGVVAQAIVNAPLLDLTQMVLAPLVGMLTGGQNYTALTQPIVITLRVPVASVPASISPAVPEVDLSAPDGAAGTGLDTSADLPTLAPPVLPQGNAMSIAQGAGKPLDPIKDTAPTAAPVVYDGGYGALPQVEVDYISGGSYLGIGADGVPFDPLAVSSTPQGQATGSATGLDVQQANAWTIKVTGLVPVLHIESDRSFFLPDPVGLSAPSAITQLGANVVTGLTDPITLTGAQGHGGLAALISPGMTSVLVLTPLGAALGAKSGTAIGVRLTPLRVVASQGYADDSVAGKVRLRRTHVAGLRPAALNPREVNLNEADGALLHRDAQARVRAAPLAAIMASPVATGGDQGFVYRGDGTWSAPLAARPYLQPICLPRASGYLGEALGAVVMGAPPTGRTLYHAFFVPYAATLSALALDVVASGTTVAAAICPLGLDGVVGASAASAVLDVSAVGPSSAQVSLALAPGWYVAALSAPDAGPTLQGCDAPVTLAADFSTRGDRSAPGPAPTAPDRYEATSAAYLRGVLQ